MTRYEINPTPSLANFCNNAWTQTFANWVVNVFTVRSQWMQIFDADFADEIVIADWATDDSGSSGQWHFRSGNDASTGINSLVLGASEDTADTFVNGARSAAKAMQAGALVRFLGFGPDHWATTLATDGQYYFDTVLGFLHTTNPVGTLDTLYSCYGASSHFLSLASNCEGFVTLGTEGFIHRSGAAQPANTRGLYRCRMDSPQLNHFMSLDPTCAGYASEGLMGYVCDGPCP